MCPFHAFTEKWWCHLSRFNFLGYVFNCSTGHLSIILFVYCRHAGQRDFKCGVCDFFGYTFTDIRKHIERRHTEMKTLICDKCGQSFKSEFAYQVSHDASTSITLLLRHRTMMSFFPVKAQNFTMDRWWACKAYIFCDICSVYYEFIMYYVIIIFFIP